MILRKRMLEGLQMLEKLSAADLKRVIELTCSCKESEDLAEAVFCRGC